MKKVSFEPWKPVSDGNSVRLRQIAKLITEFRHREPPRVRERPQQPLGSLHLFEVAIKRCSNRAPSRFTPVGGAAFNPHSPDSTRFESRGLLHQSSRIEGFWTRSRNLDANRAKRSPRFALNLDP